MDFKCEKPRSSYAVSDFVLVYTALPNGQALSPSLVLKCQASDISASPVHIARNSLKRNSRAERHALTFKQNTVKYVQSDSLDFIEGV